MLGLFKDFTPKDLISLLNSKVFNQSKAESMLKNIDINHIDKSGKNFYHHVATQENIESIKWLSKYKKININKEDNEGHTPLMIAAITGMINAMHALNARGGDIEYKNKFGRNALQESVLHGNVKSFDELYLKTKNNNPLDTYGRNLLSLAIESANLYMIEKVLKLNIIDLDQKDNEGKTILFIDACFTNVDILKKLIEHDINLSAVDKDGNSFLFHCMDKGMEAKESFELALEHGADINIKNKHGKTILMEYISQIRDFENESADYKKNIHDTINLMLYYEIDINLVDNNGESALFYALRLNELKIIDLLLDYDADPNCINKDKQTPLSLTALEGYDQFRTSTSLINAGALPNYEDEDGQTVIEKLIDFELYLHGGKKLPLKIKKRVKKNGRYMAMLEMILKNSDANLRKLNSKNEPYFFEAVFYGNIEVVKLLKTYGADINQSDQNQHNIVFRFMSMHETFKNDDAKKKYLNFLKNLIPMGVNLNEKDDFGGTTLHKAILANDEQTIKILINAGADLTAIDHRGRNMIHNTIWKNKIKLFRLIYSYNAKLLNKPDKYGVLPINYAAFLGYVDMVLELLAAGSQVNNPYPKGKYILDFLEKFHDNLSQLESKATTPIGQQKIRTLVEIMKEEFKID